MTISFKDLGLLPDLLHTLTELNYAAPTPIQAEAIPPILAGHDVMGQAQTGTGKTAAFTLPILQRLEPDGLQALILTPTRELAIQTADAIYRYGSRLGVRVLPVYGGQPYSRQTRRLNKGVNVVVGTPGRTLDLINQGALDLSTARFVVLDEADEMLKMGFIEDVEAILSATNAATRQTTIFSATLPSRIQETVTRYMRDPLLVSIKSKEMTVENIAERFHIVREQDKLAALCRLLEMEDLQNTLVFTRTKAGAAELAEALQNRGFQADALHGDLVQQDRERILRRFRTGNLTILVATDVVARGVDIPEVSHVINYDIPQLPIEYVHRIGRTGRAGRGGDAITLISPREQGRMKQIAAFTRKAIAYGQLPTETEIREARATEFKTQVIDQLSADPTKQDQALVEELIALGYDPREIAAAMLGLVRTSATHPPIERVQEYAERAPGRENQRDNFREGRTQRGQRGQHAPRERRDRTGREQGMVRLHLDIGREKGIRPADIVYSIASEASVPGNSIGAITINQYETYLDVSEKYVNAVLKGAPKVTVRGRVATLERA